jgi:hypothetical protein
MLCISPAQLKLWVSFLYGPRVDDADVSIANGRSVVFLTGVGIIWTLFIKSGNVLKNQL